MRYVRYIFYLGLGLGAVVLLVRPSVIHSAKTRIMGRATVAERVQKYGEDARQRMATHFAAAEVEYPPQRFMIVAFKLEKELHVFAANDARPWKRVLSYPILKTSGEPTPNEIWLRAERLSVSTPARAAGRAGTGY